MVLQLRTEGWGEYWPCEEMGESLVVPGVSVVEGSGVGKGLVSWRMRSERGEIVAVSILHSLSIVVTR